MAGLGTHTDVAKANLRGDGGFHSVQLPQSHPAFPSPSRPGVSLGMQAEIQALLNSPFEVKLQNDR